jgi:glycosyltransferase involved in cell wall biosynthesis
VLVVGPGERSAGGVRAVIASLDRSPLAARFRLIEVATHADGSVAVKVAQAARGMARAAGIIGRRRVDLVYLHTASYGSFRRKAIVAAMARTARIPYLMHVHGGHFDRFYASASAPERALVRSTLRGAAAVIALTPTWARRLRDIAPCRVEVVPNPVELPARRADPTSRPARLVALGRLGEAKGTGVLVRAFAALAGDHPDATLVLAGDGPREPARRLAADLGVDARVETPGWLGPAARDAVLAGASVLALPSRDEGLPVAMLEAMAWALPVVVTPVGGVPDVVQDGDVGLVVPPDDPPALERALRRLLDDPEAAREMGERGRAQVEARFALDVVGGRLGDVVAACLRAPSTNGG